MQTTFLQQTERDEQVGAALAEYDGRRAAGEGVDLLEFLAGHLDIAAELVAYFRDDAVLRGSDGNHPPMNGPAALEQYEFVRELGRGGMGVVSLMRQPGLGRLVAVKTMHSGTLAAPGRLQRFEEEAQTAGGLGHPNIVAVFETGFENDRPFYVMEYVDGETLQARLARGVLNVRAAAELIACLAGAAEAAHAQGVVHRDLKPANVILGRIPSDRPDAIRLDASGPAIVPKLTDFGLAWTADSDQRVTRPNDIVGTPEYMSPEQTAGRMETVTPATDVYALGAVLYECLTGRTPFKGANTLELLDLIRRKDPVPVRRLRPQAPRDLETLCLKCLEKEPRKRYATAAELAADLKRFLAGEPVHARRPTWAERLYKWARRHPAVAAMVLLGILSTAAFTAVILASNAALVRQRDRTADERDRTARERDRARELLALARQSVNDYTTRLNQDPRIRARDLEDLRKELLATAVRYFEALTRFAGDDPEIQEERGKAYGRLAEISADVGARAEALDLYDKSRAAIEDLVRAHPDEPAYQRSLATTLNQQANLLRRTDQPNRAEANYLQVIALWRGVADGPSGRPSDRQSLAGACGNLGNYLNDVGRADAAAAYYRESREILEKLTAEHPDEADFTRDLASTDRHIGLVLIHIGQFREAEERMTRARDLQEALVKAHPHSDDYKVHLGSTLNNLAILYTDTGRPGAAEAAYRRAVELAEHLATAHPRLLKHRFDQSQSLNNLGTLYGELGRFEEAEAALLKARDLRQKLVEADPFDPLFLHELAGSFNNLGFLYRQQGRLPEAEIAYGEAMRHRDLLSRAAPSLPDHRVGRAVALANRANLLNTTNQTGLAQAARVEALALLHGLVAEFPNHPEYNLELSRVLVGQAALAVGGRNWEEALRLYKEALALRQKLADDHPTVTEYRALVAAVHNDLGRAYHLMGRYADAARESNQAIQLIRELTSQHPTMATWRRSLVLKLFNLATAYGEGRALDRAETTFRAALDEAAAVERDFEPLPDDRKVRASILNGLGVVHHDLGRRTSGTKAYRQAVAIMEELHCEFPHNIEFAAALGLKYGNLARATQDGTNPAPALDLYATSLQTLEEALAAAPGSINAQRYYVDSLRKRAQFLAELGLHSESKRDWEAAVRRVPPELRWRYQIELAVCLGRLKDHRAATTLAGELARRTNLNGANLYDLAVAYSLSSAAARADDRLPERVKLTEDYAVQALDLLKRAREAGLFQVDASAAQLRNDPALETIRNRPEFRRLLAELE